MKRICRSLCKCTAYVQLCLIQVYLNNKHVSMPCVLTFGARDTQMPESQHCLLHVVTIYQCTNGKDLGEDADQKHAHL